MKHTLTVLILILAFAFTVAAQTERSANCPTVDVSGGGLVEVGELASFTANINAQEKDLKLEYLWTVDEGGKIISGQGTKSITVERLSERNITATVEVKGFPEGCQNIATENLGCGLIHPRSSVLVDEFGNLPYENVEAGFDAFFVALDNQPNAQGYIISYGTDREKTLRETHLKSRIKMRKYDGSRIVFVRGGAHPNGERGVLTKLWIVPPGADPPTP